MRKTQRRLEIGQQCGVLKILKVTKERSRHNPKTWLCQCEKCGKTVEYSGQQINKYQNDGCRDCRKIEKDKQRIEEVNKHAGEVYGNLEILKFTHFNDTNNPIVLTKCLKCGSKTEISLNRILAGQAKQCSGCRKENLKRGYEISKEACVEGTSLININRKNINKNSTTGINGVSYIKKLKSYRAYITFQRKQYHLGTYKNIEDAEEARKEAEKRIFGPFLEWYAETYPDKWERINKKD